MPGVTAPTADVLTATPRDATAALAMFHKCLGSHSLVGAQCHHQEVRLVRRGGANDGGAGHRVHQASSRLRHRSRRQLAHFKDHDEPYDLFIGIPVHKVPDVLVEAGLTENGWVKVDPFTLATPSAGVYALGDCAETGIPKAGVFAESAARAVADEIAAGIRGGRARPYDGSGPCFVEMGDGEVGRVDVHFRAEGRAHSSTAGTQPGARRREGRIRSSPSRPVVRPIAPSRHHRSPRGALRSPQAPAESGPEGRRPSMWPPWRSRAVHVTAKAVLRCCRALTSSSATSFWKLPPIAFISSALVPQ